MPRGDGTGPLGTGPLNRGSRGSGRGLGQRKKLNSQENCRRDGSQNKGLFENRQVSGGGGLLQGAAMKLLSMAVLAIPALLKVRNQLGAPGERDLLEQKKDKESVTIDITPSVVENKIAED